MSVNEFQLDAITLAARDLGAETADQRALIDSEIVDRAIEAATGTGVQRLDGTPLTQADLDELAREDVVESYRFGRMATPRAGGVL